MHNFRVILFTNRQTGKHMGRVKKLSTPSDDRGNNFVKHISVQSACGVTNEIQNAKSEVWDNGTFQCNLDKYFWGSGGGDGNFSKQHDFGPGQCQLAPQYEHLFIYNNSPKCHRNACNNNNNNSNSNNNNCHNHIQYNNVNYKLMSWNCTPFTNTKRTE